MFPLDAIRSVYSRMMSTSKGSKSTTVSKDVDPREIQLEAKVLPRGTPVPAFSELTTDPFDASVAPSDAADPFLAAITTRRSHYAISSSSPIPDARITHIVQHALTHVPSSWNSQTSRALVLFGPAHAWLWDTVVSSLAAITSGSKLAGAQTKIETAMKAGHGTVLFFEDAEVVSDLQARFPTYKDDFMTWSQQTSGMAQLIIWVALEKEGLGVNLQHYNNLIESDVQSQFSIPTSWRLVAQMPFGTSIADPGEKSFLPIEDRVKVFGV